MDLYGLYGAAVLYAVQNRQPFKGDIQRPLTEVRWIMAYVPVPKDLNAVKTKVIFNLTKRQLICFGSGALIGIPLFFLLKGSVGTSAASIIMVVTMLPCFLFALFEKHGQPLEKVLRNILRVAFLRPKKRPYMTNNFYSVLERQNTLDKEVRRIIRKRS